MICIIQARMSSKRLPGKILKKINKLTLIEILINNLRRNNLFDKIIVATSNHKTDLKLVKFCQKKKINFFVGPLNNVYKRLLECAVVNSADFFLRINGDSPFIDIQVVKQLLRIKSKNKKYDIYTNVFPSTYPRGQSLEIIKTETMKKIKKLNKSDKEHVTTYFYRNNKKFKILNMKNKINLSDLNLCIDKYNDLQYFSKILKKINLKEYMEYKKLLKTMKNYEKN